MDEVIGTHNLRAVLAEYEERYNTARPHQGIGQRVPGTALHAPHVITAGFDSHQRLHSEAAFRDAVKRTDGLTVIATQTFNHPRLSTAGRLRAQAEGRHYSTFSLYTPEELRASIATFLSRLPSPEVSWVDEHLLVVVGGSRRN